MFSGLKFCWNVWKLKHANPYVRRKAASKLAEIGSPLSMKVIASAIASESDLYALRDMIHLLSKFGPLAVPLLTQYLRSGSSTETGAAASALAKIKDKSVVPVLIELLPKYTDDAGANIAYALGELGGEQAKEPLFCAVNGHISAQWPRLVTAAEALAKLGDQRGVGLLIDLMERGAWRFREDAAEALGRIGDDKSKEALIRALALDFGVNMQAAKSLEIMGEGKWAKWISGPGETFIQLLGESSDSRAVDPLVFLLTYRGVTTRGLAAEALRRLLIGPKGDEALKRLQKVAHNDCEEQVRLTASKMLSQMQGQVERKVR